MMIQTMLGFILSTTIVLLAYYKESLSISGGVAAIMVGTLIYAFGGPYLFSVLIIFFAASALIGSLRTNPAPANRNALQVLSNALFATVFAILYFIDGAQMYLILYFVTIGVSASDTFSSELGRLSKKEPRHLFTRKTMANGLSGAVSPLGFLGAFLGATLFASLAIPFIRDPQIIILIGIAAFSGSLIDSALGTIQVKFLDKESGAIVESPGSNTTHHSGVRLLGNSGVNFIANAMIVVILYLYFL